MLFMPLCPRTPPCHLCFEEMAHLCVCSLTWCFYSQGKCPKGPGRPGTLLAITREMQVTSGNRPRSAPQQELSASIVKGLRPRALCEVNMPSFTT